MQVWLQARKYTNFHASAARTSDCSMRGFTCLFCPAAQLQRCAALCVWEVHAPDAFSFLICCNSSSLAPIATCLTRHSSKIPSKWRTGICMVGVGARAATG